MAQNTGPFTNEQLQSQVLLVSFTMTRLLLIDSLISKTGWCRK